MRALAAKMGEKGVPMDKARQPNERIQRAIFNLLLDRPEWQGYLEEMIAWEEANPSENRWHGWKWADVHTAVSIVNSMISQGIINQVFASRSQTVYRLASLQDTKDALAAVEMGPPPRDGEVKVEDLFGLVVGHDRTKQVLRLAIKAERPVHVLMIGPPGTAKTQMLMDVARLPGAQLYVGSTISRSGLVGLLLEVRPRYLIIDELERMLPADMAPLLNLMEGGYVTRLIHGHRERQQMDCRVFAGANDVRKIEAQMPAIVSRFARCEVPGYSPKVYVEVAQKVLMLHEGLEKYPQVALLIANETVKHSTDIRDAVRVARMAGADPRRVVEVCACLWPERVTPIRRG